VASVSRSAGDASLQLPVRRAPAAGGLHAAWHHHPVKNEEARRTQRLDDLVRLRRVRDRIDREYAQPLDVEALARGAHMSAGHLSRQFRLAFGESPYSYLMTRRIERAMALLRRGDLSVTEVCFAVGCSSLGTFSARFAELVGVPPSAYRRDAGSATAGMPPCLAKHVTRPIRNREAPAPAPRLA
jgi:AraC-like DNA-binding protein